jgi:transcriptional regulator with XRE-family HTH domain
MTSIPKYLSIGSRIASIRSIKNLTQAKFAKEIGISRPSLSVIESGQTKPSMPILLAIEYKYSVKYEWIMTGDGPMYVTGSYGLNDITPVSASEKSNRAFLYWSGFLKRIFEEGDQTKIEAIKGSLRALDPKKALQKEDCNTEKKAM